jgi:predicted peptidase
MKINNVKDKDFVYNDVAFIGREYLSSTATDVMCLFFHGVGEKGPANGSELWEVEKNNGWPKFAKGERYPAQMNGAVEYPFNMFAIQIQTEYTDAILSNIIPACKERYGAKRFIIVGISLGCIALYRLIGKFGDESIKVVVPICGNGSRHNDEETMTTLQGLAWHSEFDPTVSYKSHRDLVDRYNRFHKPKGGHILFNTLKDNSHAAWNRAFDINPDNDKSLDFVSSVLKIGKYAESVPAPTESTVSVSEFNAAIDEAVKLLQSKKK